jgi:hypothetical protein
VEELLLLLLDLLVRSLFFWLFSELTLSLQPLLPQVLFLLRRLQLPRKLRRLLMPLRVVWICSVAVVEEETIKLLFACD